jgi:hypothetical protein
MRDFFGEGGNLLLFIDIKLSDTKVLISVGQWVKNDTSKEEFLGSHDLLSSFNW